MVAIASVLVVVIVSLIITRIATVALTLTGLSSEVARFQARSALSGVGFTTSEAEGIVNHPVRRRVVMSLMLVGSAGLTTAVAGLILSFVNTDTAQAGRRLAVLLPALLLILLVARSRVVDGWLSVLITRGLDRWTELDASDYASLLRIGGDYAVSEVAVREDSFLASGELGSLRLREEGAILLGVTRGDGTYEGAPAFSTRLAPGDTAVLYGRRSVLCDLEDRRSESSR